MTEIRHQNFRSFLTERFTAVAVEIFGEAEAIMEAYYEENKRLRNILHMVVNPEIKLPRIDDIQQARDARKEISKPTHFCPKEEETEHEIRWHSVHQQQQHHHHQQQQQQQQQQQHQQPNQPQPLQQHQQPSQIELKVQPPPPIVQKVYHNNTSFEVKEDPDSDMPFMSDSIHVQTVEVNQDTSATNSSGEVVDEGDCAFSDDTVTCGSMDEDDADETLDTQDQDGHFGKKALDKIQEISEGESDGGEIRGADLDWSSEDSSESSESEPELPRPKKFKPFQPAAQSTLSTQEQCDVVLDSDSAQPSSSAETPADMTASTSPDASSTNTGRRQCEQAKDGTVWEVIQPGAQSGRTESQNLLTESGEPTDNAKQNIEDALSAFLCLVDRKMLQHIRDCTVAEARRVDERWDLSIAELKAFIALLYVRGTYSKNLEMESLWSEEWGLSFFRSTMPRSRFRETMRYLRFDMKKDRRTRLCTDRFGLVSDVWSGFVENCTASYKPGAYIMVDEQLFPTKARCRFTQYMAGKPDKFGIKFWLVADVETKYFLNGFPYLGKEEARPSRQRLGERVVMRLLEPYVGQGRTVTMNSFFTSLNLAKNLQQKKTTLVGACNRNRRELPPSVQKQQEELFSTKVLKHDCATLTVYQGKPGKNVALLSTMHPSVTIGGDRKKRPETVTFYNSTKVGVDALDQMARLYTVKGATRRWPVAVFYNLLDLAAINAHILFKSCIDYTAPRRAFILQLAKELREEHVGCKVPLLMVPQEQQVPANRRQCQINTHCKKNKTLVACKGCHRPVCGKCAVRVDSFCPICAL